mgnify:FL=1
MATRGPDMIPALRKAVESGKKFAHQREAGAWIQEILGADSGTMALLRTVSVPSTAAGASLAGAQEQAWKILLGAVEKRDAAALRRAEAGISGVTPTRAKPSPTRVAPPTPTPRKPSPPAPKRKTTPKKPSVPAAPKRKTTAKKPSVPAPKKASAAARAAAEVVAKEAVLRAAKIAAKGTAMGKKHRVSFEFELIPVK